METRTTHEAKIFLLIMNGVRCRFEDCQIVAVAEELEAMRKYVNSQFAEEVWIDDTFADIDGHTLQKCFKKGSDLEPFNKPWLSLYEEPQDVSTRRSGDTGIFYEWVPVDQLDSIKLRFHFIN